MNRIDKSVGRREGESRKVIALAALLLILLFGSAAHAEQICSDCHNTGPHTQCDADNCAACHGNPPVDAAGLIHPYAGQTNPVSSGSGSAGAHGKHATPSGYNFPCSACHYGGMNASSGQMVGGTDNGNGSLQMGFSIPMPFGATLAGGTYNGVTGLAYLYQGTNGTVVNTGGVKTCSNIYCHSDGTYVSTGSITAGTASPLWDTASVPMACDGCHGYPPAYPNGVPKKNSHQFPSHNVCRICHFGTTQDSTTITNTANHVNGEFNVQPDTSATFNGVPVNFTYTYNVTGGTCTNISCHNGTSWTWGQPFTPDYCAVCHTNIIQSGADQNHHSGTCNTCHGTATWALHQIVPRPSCASVSCHVGKTLPGHGPGAGVPADCTGCHTTGVTPAADYSNTCGKCHATGVDGAPVFTGAQLAATGTAHDGVQTDMDCIQCHTMNILHRTGSATPGPMTVSSSCKTCHLAGMAAHSELSFNLATGCNQCHNPAVPGAPLLSMEILTSYAGGIHLDVPTAEFTAINSTTTSYLVNFDASLSSCPTGYTCTYGWDFGDGATGTGITNTHTYAGGTARTAMLTVTASSGRTSTKAKDILPSAANHAPTASHGPVTVSLYTVSFADTSTDAAGNSPSGITSVSVNWGDGNVVGCTPSGTCSHTYAGAGTFSIIQTVTNAAGLSNSAAGFNVTVPQKFTISGRVLDSSNNGISASLSLKLGGTIKGSTTSGADGNYSFTNVDPGSYTVNAFKSGTTFEQSSIPVTVTSTDVTGVDFHAITAINGQCGSSNGQAFNTAPTTNLCSVGTPSAVGGTGPWTWTCAGANGGTTANCSANIQYALDISSEGTGTGRVTGAGNYLSGANAQVTAAADANSTFDGWSGDCSSYGTATSFQISMTQARNCAATFTLNPAITNPVKLNSTAYMTLQEALDAVTSDSDVAMVMSGKYEFGNVVFNKTNTITLKGGYDAGFADNTTGAYTTISGSLTVQQGTLTVEKIGIR